MITQLDNQSWSKELVTGNAQFIEVGTTMYVVSQVRADNTFAVFKSEPTPPTPGPGYKFDITATYTFPTVNGKNNTSFDPVIAYDDNGQTLYIIGTQDDADGKDIDVLIFAYNTANDTLGAPTTLVTASYIRDSYDICVLESQTSPPGTTHTFVAVSVTNPTQIWQTTTTAPVTSINISGDVLTVLCSNNFSAGQKISFSGLQNATFLNGVTVTVLVATPDGFTATYVAANYTQSGYESGFATWLPGHSLLGFELVDTVSPPSVSVVGITVLDQSPFRTGNVFGAVSTYSPDGVSIEVYYESHPKQVTFTDQIFSINYISRSPVGSPPVNTWSSVNTLKTFTGRYADSRLTVVPSGSSRILLQQYYSQLVHQNALVGNLLLGYYGPSNSSPPTSGWTFHVQPGSNTTSYIQGTLSVSETQGAFVSYLAEPTYNIRGVWSPQVKTYSVDDRVSFDNIDYIVNTAITYAYQGTWLGGSAYAAGSVVAVALPTLPPETVFYTATKNIAVSSISPNLDTANWTATTTPPSDSRFTPAPTSWPLHTNTLDLSTFNMTDVPGFYNTLNFTWLRGAKSILDDGTQWAIVGERVGSETSGATYVSNFNVPPVVSLSPDGFTTIVERGTPLFLDASGTNDGNLDPISFVWTMNSSNSHIHLTPSASGSTATLLIDRAIGGASFTNPLLVGVVALTTQHQPTLITNIAVSSGVATITTSTPVSFAAGEKAFLYNIATATFLNDRVGVVQMAAFGDVFSVTFTDGQPTPDYTSAPDTGDVIANAQFDFVAINIPFNPGPTIDFTHDSVTHGAVSLPIQAARNSIVLIRPTYTGVTDPDDLTTYAWTQVSGTPVPIIQILSGTASPNLQFEDNGSLLQGDTLVFQLTVSDGVNPSVSGTVTIDVAGYPFVYQDSRRLSRTIWGPQGSPLFQSTFYSVYYVEPPGTSLQFTSPTQNGSLILAFEANNKGITPNDKLFNGQSFTNAAGDAVFTSPPTGEWALDYILNAASGSTVTGFTQTAGTDLNQNPDWVIAEFDGQFNTFDQSHHATLGYAAMLTTTNATGKAALVIATVKMYNNDNGLITGAVPTGWNVLTYHNNGNGGGAWSIVLYRIVTEPGTDVSFVWASQEGNAAMETSLTSFNTSAPYVVGTTSGNISQRNSINSYSPLDISTLYTNFGSVKRNSVLDGTDRYLIISNASVMVYGGINPNLVLLRKLFLPLMNRNIVSIGRVSNIVTLTLNNGLVNPGGVFNFQVENVADSSYDGLFPVTQVNPTDNTVWRYAVVGSDGSSTGGTVSVQYQIVDAVHTESDYTLVIDNSGMLYRYSTAEVINTDFPDTSINLTTLTSQTFNKVFSTTSFANSRVIILTGPGGCLLLQVRSTDLAIQGSLEFTVESGLLYGVDNVQFVRTSNVESLTTGKVLLGTIAPVSANITSVRVFDNAVIVTAANTFTTNQVVTFANLTNATFLNGLTAGIVSATPTQFVISYTYGNYADTPEPAGATAATGGKTYETLIDLSHGQIIGTWDASKLRNQFVSTGEILFEPNDTYAGIPAAPVMKPVVNQGAVNGSPNTVSLLVSWIADRPDLINSYDLEISLDGVNWTVNLINSGAIQSVTLPEPIGQLFYFRIRAYSVDGVSAYSTPIVTFQT